MQMQNNNVDVPKSPQAQLEKAQKNNILDDK